jgi:iron complex outermembrane recepter protein
MRTPTSIFSLAGAGIALTAICANTSADTVAELSPIVVTATRIAQSSFDVPASIDRVDQQQIQQGQLEVNLSEPLLTVPGVSAESRQNYAQDLQLSIRGFGARSSFGVRGVRLYSDGIPGTMPDGQGQFSQFDLGSADHIEVLRGPFSALYGNSSGGVIALFTEDAKPGYLLDGTVEYGTFDTQRYALKTTGDNGSVNYVVDAAHFRTNGYREHSDAERNNFNAKVRLDPSETSKLTLVVNAIQTPSVQDPLGLTAAQVQENPTQAGKNAIAYNTRKSLAQEQLGVIYEDRLSSNDSFSATVYGGHRTTTQFHSQLHRSSAQRSRRRDRSEPLLLGHRCARDGSAQSFGGPLQLVGGVSYDDLQEARKDFVNFVGDELGVEGPIRVDEFNQVYDFDQYLQAQWDPVARWRLIAGVRNNVVDVTSHNDLPNVGDPDSGVRYGAVDPVAGVTFRAAPMLKVYASYGKGFETPTLNDLAYRSVNGSLPGLNYALKPARSDNYEAGLKTGNEHVRADLAAFYVKTIDELAVLENADGKTVDQNIGDVGTPCEPVAVNPSSYLPAVARNSLYAGMTWRDAPSGLSETLEVQSRARIYADDRNTESAPGYWLLNYRAGFEQQTAHWHFSEFGRIDNITNRFYIGSVIVNATGSQYFEPAPGRTFLIIFNAAHRSQGMQD